MSFLDIPPGPTSAQIAARQVRLSLADAKDAMVAALQQVHTQLYLINGVDPQDVFDDFGTSAAKYIDIRDAFVACLTAVATANGKIIDQYIDSIYYNPPEGKVLTVNVDGTITYEDAP
jgi:hypothetical protein